MYIYVYVQRRCFRYCAHSHKNCNPRVRILSMQVAMLRFAYHRTLSVPHRPRRSLHSCRRRSSCTTMCITAASIFHLLLHWKGCCALSHSSSHTRTRSEIPIAKYKRRAPFLITFCKLLERKGINKDINTQKHTYV
jgi:hypothetical protein